MTIEKRIKHNRALRKTTMVSEKKHEAVKRYLFQMSEIPWEPHQKRQRTSSRRRRRRSAEEDRRNTSVEATYQTYVRRKDKSKKLKRGRDEELTQEERRNANAEFVDLLVLAKSAALLESKGMDNVDKSRDATDTFGSVQAKKYDLRRVDKSMDANGRICNVQAEKDALFNFDKLLDATDRIDNAEAEKNALHNVDNLLDVSDRIGNAQAGKDALRVKGSSHRAHFRHQALMYLGLGLSRSIQVDEHDDLEWVEDTKIDDSANGDQVEEEMCVQDVPDLCVATERGPKGLEGVRKQASLVEAVTTNTKESQPCVKRNKINRAVRITAKFGDSREQSDACLRRKDTTGNMNGLLKENIRNPSQEHGHAPPNCQTEQSVTYMSDAENWKQSIIMHNTELLANQMAESLNEGSSAARQKRMERTLERRKQRSGNPQQIVQQPGVTSRYSLPQTTQMSPEHGDRMEKGDVTRLLAKATTSKLNGSLQEKEQECGRAPILLQAGVTSRYILPRTGRTEKGHVPLQLAKDTSAKLNGSLQERNLKTQQECGHAPTVLPPGVTFRYILPRTTQMAPEHGDRMQNGDVTRQLGKDITAKLKGSLQEKNLKTQQEFGHAPIVLQQGVTSRYILPRTAQMAPEHGDRMQKGDVTPRLGKDTTAKFNFSLQEKIFKKQQERGHAPIVLQPGVTSRYILPLTAQMAPEQGDRMQKGVITHQLGKDTTAKLNGSLQEKNLKAQQEFGHAPIVLQQGVTTRYIIPRTTQMAPEHGDRMPKGDVTRRLGKDVTAKFNFSLQEKNYKTQQERGHAPIVLQPGVTTSYILPPTAEMTTELGDHMEKGDLTRQLGKDTTAKLDGSLQEKNLKPQQEFGHARIVLQPDVLRTEHGDCMEQSNVTRQLAKDTTAKMNGSLQVNNLNSQQECGHAPFNCETEPSSKHLSAALESHDSVALDGEKQKRTTVSQMPKSLNHNVIAHLRQMLRSVEQWTQPKQKTCENWKRKDAADFKSFKATRDYERLKAQQVQGAIHLKDTQDLHVATERGPKGLEGVRKQASLVEAATTNTKELQPCLKPDKIIPWAVGMTADICDSRDQSDACLRRKDRTGNMNGSLNKYNPKPPQEHKHAPPNCQIKPSLTRISNAVKVNGSLQEKNLKAQQKCGHAPLNCETEPSRTHLSETLESRNSVPLEDIRSDERMEAQQVQGALHLQDAQEAPVIAKSGSDKIVDIRKQASKLDPVEGTNENSGTCGAHQLIEDLCVATERGPKGLEDVRKQASLVEVTNTKELQPCAEPEKIVPRQISPFLEWLQRAVRMTAANIGDSREKSDACLLTKDRTGDCMEQGDVTRQLTEDTTAKVNLEDTRHGERVEAEQVQRAIHLHDTQDISEPNELDDARVSVGLKKFWTEISVERRRELLPAFKSSFPDSLVEQESCIDKDIPYVPAKELKKREKRLHRKIQAMAKPSGSKSNEPLALKKSAFTRKRGHERVPEGPSKKSVDETRTGQIRSEVRREASVGADTEQQVVVGASPRTPLSGATGKGVDQVLGSSGGGPPMALPLSRSRVVAEPTFMRFPYERRNNVQARNLDLARNVSDATLFSAPITDGEGRPIHIDAEALQDPVVGGGLLNKMVLPKDFDKLNQFGPGELAQDLAGDIYRSNSRATVLIGQIYDLEQKYERLRKSTSRAEVDKMVSEINALNAQVGRFEESERVLKKESAILTLQKKKLTEELSRKEAEMANKMSVIDSLSADKARLVEDSKLKTDIHETVRKDLLTAKERCEELEKEIAILKAEKASVTDLFCAQQGETLWLEKILHYHMENCSTLSDDIETLEAQPATPEEPLVDGGVVNPDVVDEQSETQADAAASTTVVAASGVTEVVQPDAPDADKTVVVV